MHGAIGSTPDKEKQAMSFPSVVKFLNEGKRGAEALLAAVRVDCSDAVRFLHEKAHESLELGNPVMWSMDPNSEIGRQLIRIHASDAVRPIVERHICHGLNLTFLNCCNGIVGGDKKTADELVDLQIGCQAGPIAYADC